MAKLAKIDEQILTSDDFIQFLKLNGKYNELLNELIGHKMTVQAAKKQGIRIEESEVQERADQYRRVYGLHRRKDMLQHLQNLGISLDQFAQSLEENLIHEKICAEIQNDAAIAEYYALHSPQYESVQLSHMILDSEGCTREIMAILADAPETFADLAAEHSIAYDSADDGGSIGKVYKGILAPEIEARIFNAESGAIVGPFTDEEGLFYEIFLVESKFQAECDTDTRNKIKQHLYDSWLQSQWDSCQIETL